MRGDRRSCSYRTSGWVRCKFHLDPCKGATAEPSFLTEKTIHNKRGVADYLFLFAVTDPSRHSRSRLSAFVVPRSSKGLDVVKAYGLLGMRGANVVHLWFRRVVVPGENLVWGLNHGFPTVLDELDRERPAVAGGMRGIARSSLEAAVNYSSTREQFGRPIRHFEGVSFKIADMAVKLEASRLLILHAVRILDRGEGARREGAVARGLRDGNCLRSGTFIFAGPWRNRLH